jgi:DnaJ-class molecular chaperone
VTPTKAAGEPATEEGGLRPCPECGGDGQIEEEFSPTDPDPRLVGGVRIPCPDCDGTGHLPVLRRGDRS